MYDLFAFVFQNSFLLRGTVLFVFGAIVGSFLNVVVYRLPKMLYAKWHNECVKLLGEGCKLANIAEDINLIHPSSHCVFCKAKIPFWANVPLLGYVLLNGKCFNCKSKISVRYPLVELMTGILFLAVGYITSDTFILPSLLVFISFIICIILIDYDTFIIPDELSMPLLWLGILVNLHGKIAGSLENAVLGAVLGYIMLWSIFIIFKYFSRKDGMGYGDFKLLAAILAWVGYQGLIPVTLFASLFGIIYFFILRYTNKYIVKTKLPAILEHRVAFGPFLGSAALLFIFAGKYLINILG